MMNETNTTIDKELEAMTTTTAQLQAPQVKCDQCGKVTFGSVRNGNRQVCVSCFTSSTLLETATTTKRYRAQCARDAQRMEFGPESYWDALEESALEHYRKGVKDALTESLAEALEGNERD